MCILLRLLVSLTLSLCLSESTVQQRVGNYLRSNPKITRLAQLQSGPHYTASQNREREIQDQSKQRGKAEM